MFGNNFDRPKKDPYEDKMKELEILVREKGFKGEDFRQAYIMSFGVEPEIVVSPEVEELAETLKTLSTNNTLPLTRLSELMVSLEEEDLMINEYVNLVDTLSLTDKEKDVLKSIVEKEKSGVLHISVEGKQAKIGLSIDRKAAPLNLKYHLAQELIRILGVLKEAKKLEIEFES